MTGTDHDAETDEAKRAGSDDASAGGASGDGAVDEADGASDGGDGPPEVATDGSGATADDAAAADAGAAADAEASVDDGGSTGVGTHLYRGALVLLVLLAVVATLQLYFSLGRAINIWISDDFAPIFQSVLHLVVLLAAAIGISRVLRKLGE